METMNIHGWEWQHALDLQNRGIFDNFYTSRIEKESILNSDANSSAVIVPISQTKKVIKNIIEENPEQEIIKNIIEENPEQEIINFSWIMWTTPENHKDISNFHFLFWPNAERWLKVAFAWNFTNRVNNIIKNVTCAKMTVIETDIDTHDKVVSIIQAFSHMFIFLSWMSDNQNLIHEWNTPDLTIWDMILENPKFVNLLNNLQKSIQIWDNLSEIFLDSLSNITEININNFWTPTFLRVVKFCMKNKMIINQEMFHALHSIQNRDLLLNSIHDIKSNLWVI